MWHRALSSTEDNIAGRAFFLNSKLVGFLINMHGLDQQVYFVTQDLIAVDETDLVERKVFFIFFYFFKINVQFLITLNSNTTK